MRVGQHIRDALAIVDKAGPCTSGEVCPQMPSVERSNVGKYLRRAVGLRLMTIDRSQSPHVFAVVPGWRERVGITTRLSEPKPAPVYKPRPCALQQAWGALC